METQIGLDLMALMVVHLLHFQFRHQVEPAAAELLGS